MVAYAGLAALPHFNPDLDGDLVPESVLRFRAAVASADVIVISTPEYAHGVPGTLKNALDWLVGDPAFVGKRIVLLQADRRSTWALDSLREILRTMSGCIVDEACVLLAIGSNRIDEEGILMKDDLRQLLQLSVSALMNTHSHQSGVYGNRIDHKQYEKLTHEEWKKLVAVEAKRNGKVRYYTATCPICMISYDAEVLSSQASARVFASQRVASHILQSHRDRVVMGAWWK